jgi:endonuclease/exonuclease/phosphatase family metal-dependent hydrolase
MVRRLGSHGSCQTSATSSGEPPLSPARAAAAAAERRLSARLQPSPRRKAKTLRAPIQKHQRPTIPGHREQLKMIRVQTATNAGKITTVLGSVATVAPITAVGTESSKVPCEYFAARAHHEDNGGNIRVPDTDGTGNYGARGEEWHYTYVKCTSDLAEQLQRDNTASDEQLARQLQHREIEASDGRLAWQLLQVERDEQLARQMNGQDFTRTTKTDSSLATASPCIDLTATAGEEHSKSITAVAARICLACKGKHRRHTCTKGSHTNRHLHNASRKGQAHGKQSNSAIPIPAQVVALPTANVVDEGNVRQLPHDSKSLRFLTYNLGMLNRRFGLTEPKPPKAYKVEAIFDLIQKHRPDLIALQESPASVTDCLKQLGYVVHRATDVAPDRSFVRGESSQHLTLATKSPFAFTRIEFSEFPTAVMRKTVDGRPILHPHVCGLLWGELCTPSGKSVAVGCLHLRSRLKQNAVTESVLDNQGKHRAPHAYKDAVRHVQIQSAVDVLGCAADEQNMDALLLGDFNWSEHGCKCGCFEKLSRKNEYIVDGTMPSATFTDLWPFLRDRDRGFTVDGNRGHLTGAFHRHRSRPDRALFKPRVSDGQGNSGGGYKAESIELVGQQTLQSEIAPGHVVTFLPSDHYGVLGQLCCS